MKFPVFLLLLFTTSLYAQRSNQYITNVKAPLIVTEKSKINWQTNSFENVVAAARLENKRILVYFTAKWCGPCKKMDQNVFQDDSVVNIVGRYIAVKIDVDSWTAANWVNRLPAKSLPTFFMLDTAGKPTSSRVGYMEETQFLDFLGSISLAKQSNTLEAPLNDTKRRIWKHKISMGFGTGVSNLTNTEAAKIFAYDARVGISIEKKRVFFNPYLQFASLGNADARLNYLRIPIDFGLNAYRGQVLGLAGGYRLLAGPYYALLLNQSGLNVKKFDVGLNYGIGAYIGDIDRMSFEVSFKVSQGFADVNPIMPGNQQNRYIGVSLNLGFKKG